MKLSFSTYTQAVVLPPLGENATPLGGVVESSGRYIENSCPNAGAGGEYNPEKVAESNECVIYLGWINQVWGHTITDVLKKIWFVHTPEYKEFVDQGVKPVYVSHLNTVPAFVVELLSLAGFDLHSAQQISQPTRFAKVVMPDDCFVSYGNPPYFTAEYKELIARIRQAVDKYPCCDPVAERLYFTRSSVSRSFNWKRLWMPKEVGEERLERAFAAADYEIVDPAELSPARQIRLLMNCKAFAATEGSISHNSVFCATGTKVAILKKEPAPNLYTPLCNEAAGVEAEVLIAHASRNVKSTFYGPFYLYVSREVKRYLLLLDPAARIESQHYWLDPLWYWYMIHDTLLGRALQKLLRK